MMKKGKKSPEDSSLRQKAEAKLNGLRSAKLKTLTDGAGKISSEPEMLKLIHELQVHQIELEMQNEELQQTAATASALYDFAPNGYFTIGPDGTITQLNHSGAKMLGKERICLENSNLKLFITDGTKLVFADFLERCFKTTLKQTCEIGLSVHGKPFSYLYLEGMLTEDKEHCLLIAIDITDRKLVEAEVLKSKQQYDNLVAQIPVGVYVLKTKPDYTFKLEYVSPVMAGILDLSVERLLADTETIFKAIHPDDVEEVFRLNLEGIKLKRPFDWKGRVVVKGVVRWVHLSSLPQQQENGDILWHGLIVDITEQIRDEAEIKKQNEKLQELNATKDKFFSIIAHDLKSPFSSFLGLTQIMAEELPNLTMLQVQEIAVSMSKSAANLYRLLENLLQWSRMQQGTIKFNPEPVQLQPILTESIEMIQESAKSKSIEIATDVPDGLAVFADADMLQTVIRNLVSNAVKFTPKGGKVNLSAKIAEDKKIEISICDTGIGMRQTMIENLFRIDIQTSRKGTDGEPSTGLGLILCKEFIEKHGGKIWVESEVEKGSTFYFTLPSNPVSK